MSSLKGSVVDVVRERERQARLQLLDEFRDPSPQPIFSQPVKVELEDETSRRIKHTLGDFTQLQHVLIHDPKHLIGISNPGAVVASTAASPVAHPEVPGSGSVWSSQRHINGTSSKGALVNSSKRSVLVNGQHKLPTSGTVITSKKPHQSSKLGGDHHHHHHHHKKTASSVPKQRSDLPKINPISSNYSTHSEHQQHNRVHEKGVKGPVTIAVVVANSREKEHRRTKSRPVSVAANNVDASSVTSNSSSVNSVNKPSVLHNGIMPNGLVRQRLNDPPIKKSQAKHTPSKVKIPDQEERSSLSHFEVESILKEMKQAVPPPLTAIQTPRTEERGFHFPTDIIKKEAFHHGKDHLPLSDGAPIHDQLFSSRVVPNSAPKKTPSHFSPFNLQEDLEMSDSDDEGSMVPSCKNPELSEIPLSPKSPLNGENSCAKTMVSSENIQHDSSRSSSSESSDSDSEDSCSESNDSESSASSDNSDLEAASKPAPQLWGLSNFIDETRRNHSPAFVAHDTNTNSSITAVKEEPVHCINRDKDGFSLADEDSVNCILGKYSDPELQSPMGDLFNLDSGPASLKPESVSPLASPVRSPVPPPPPPLRGPRTPPTTPPEDKEPPKHITGLENEEKIIADIKKCSPVKSEHKPRLDPKSEQRAKKKNLPKATIPPMVEQSKSRSGSSSASKERIKDGKDIHSSNSCPVPSLSSTKTVHRMPPKSHHRKHSASSPVITKRDSSQTESNPVENKNELHPSFKSKSFPRHSGEPDESASISRSSSRASSAAMSESSSAHVEALAKKEISKREKTQKQEARRGASKHTRSEKMSSKSSTHAGKSSSSGKSSRSKTDKHSSRTTSTKADLKKSSKKKSSKFSIKNFLQSPRSERNECDFKEDSPSPERSPELRSSPASSPVREEPHAVSRESSRQEKRRKSSTSSFTSQSRSRSNSRSRHTDEIPKKGSSNKKPISRSLDEKKKKKHRDNTKTVQESTVSITSPIRHHEPPDFDSMELPSHPPVLLSPIPPAKVDSAITPLMVSIPLAKLLRIPGHPELKPPKDRTEEAVKMPDITERDSAPSSSVDGRSAISHAVSPRKKEHKSKHRTEHSKSSLGKSSSEKSFKTAKAEKPSSSSHRNVSPAVSEKISIDSTEKSKPSSENEIQPLKKRKVEETEVPVKKKPKVSVKPFQAAEAECNEKMPIVKIERMDKLEMYTEKRSTPKRLERRDSASSISSLCSQQSHKSSKSSKEKSKEVVKENSDVNKLSISGSSTKEVKREKEEKSKISIKKEPGVSVKTEKFKSRSKDKLASKGGSMNSDNRKAATIIKSENLNASSQANYWQNSCKAEDTKAQLTNHQRIAPMDYGASRDAGSEWERFAPDIQHEMKALSNHINKVNVPVPMDYYYTEGKKLKHSAEKETDPVQQALKYFEATVMFVLTSHHRELSNKDPDSIYQMYRDTLKFTHVIRSCIQKNQLHSLPGNVDFKILILCLKCQSLLHLKLYSLKIKEVKEQHKGVSDFMHVSADFMHSSSSKMGSHPSPQRAGNFHSRSLQPSPCQPRVGGPGSVPSPHSPTPSPAGSVASVGSQSSGYSSSEINGNHSRAPHSSLQLPHVPQLAAVAVPQTMFDVMARHHTHLSNLHMCHELWEQADMYMTRSNSKDFFKEVAEKSERLSLHSNIKELINYLQTGLSLLKDC